VNIRLLSALNVAMTDDELLDLIDHVADSLADGLIYAVSDRDLILSLHLTETGRQLWPATLPATSA
jgi:hypothetical protein